MIAVQNRQSATVRLQVEDYDLAATLTSGQAFRWQRNGDYWQGIIGTRWVQLSTVTDGILAKAAEPNESWDWLTNYLQLNVHLPEILATFPKDQPMTAAVRSCRGLRLLRQEPWECLASFILSSTKQIVQIRQIVQLVCERFGEPVVVPDTVPPAYAFPSPQRLAEVSESELRACKMGFRAPYLKAAASLIAANRIDLAALQKEPLETARTALLTLPGVGRKIADCVLLFAYGFPTAFPVDVWVIKALRELYFRGRRVNPKRLQKFADSHFGPNAGYAQQYLFHYMRVQKTPRNQPQPV